MTIGLLAPLLGYLATLLPKAADEVAMSPIKQGVKSMYGDNKQQQGLMAAPPQQASGLAGQMQPQTNPGMDGMMTPGPMPSSGPGIMQQQPHQNTDEGHSHSHPGMSALGDALVLYGQMTSPNGDPKAALQMIQQRRQAQAQAQMQAAEVAREQANRQEDVARETRQFDVSTGLKQDQLKQGADQFAASEEDKRLTREAQAKQAAADNALNTGKLDLERTNAANENQYRQGMLANAQAETKQKQQQAAMSSLFTTQIMSRMGLLPHDAPQQVALMHDTAQANNPGQPGMGTPQPQQASMEQPQPGQQDYLDQLHEYGLSDAQIMTAAMAKDPAKALNDAINTARTTSGETTFNEKRAENEVERINVLQKNADVAANQNNALGAIEPVLEQAFTGKFAGTKADIINALGSVGVPLGQEVTNAAGATQAAQGFINRLVQEMAGGNLSKGITDQDRIFFEKQAVNPNMTPAGNKILIKGIKSINQRNIELNQMAIAEMHKNKGHLPDDWNDKVQQYAKDHPIFSPEDRTIGLSQGGTGASWNKTQSGVSWRPVQ